MSVNKYFLALVCVAFIAGCSKKEEPVKIDVAAPETYRDNATHFELQFPGNWPKAVEPGQRVIFYSSKEAQFRLTPPFSDGMEKGAKIEVGAARGDAAAMAKAISDFKADYSIAKFEPDESTTLAGSPATKLTYSLETGIGALHATRTYALSDSFYTYLECAWFDESQAGAKPAFDQAMSSLKLAHTISAAAAAAQAQEASPNLEKFDNESFSIQYPDNFSAHNGKGTGMLATATFRGDRNDCDLQVDVFDAKNLTVDKVFDQNKSKYPNAGSSSDVQMDGNAGKYLNYSPVKDVSSRVYFTVKNNKVYRIITNWYKPMQEGFLPVFEKCVASLKIK
jgi:hypothetical protein